MRKHYNLYRAEYELSPIEQGFSHYALVSASSSERVKPLLEDALHREVDILKVKKSEVRVSGEEERIILMR